MDIVGTYDSYVEGAPQQLQRELSIGFGDDDDDDDDDDGINQPAQLVTRPFWLLYGSRPKTPERFLVKDLFSHFSHGLKPASRKFRARAAQGTRKYYCYHYYKYYF